MIERLNEVLQNLLFPNIEKVFLQESVKLLFSTYERTQIRGCADRGGMWRLERRR